MKYDLLKIMDNLGIQYQYVEHEPITNYEIAKKVDEEYNLEGTESKNLFLKDKNGTYYVFITEEGVRFNRAFLKEVTGEKLSITSAEELEEKTGYKVGCATNFGYDADVVFIVDAEIFNHEKLICSAGSPTQSMVIHTADLKKIYQTISNHILYVQVPREPQL